MTKIRIQEFWPTGRPQVQAPGDWTLAENEKKGVGSRGKVALLGHLLPLLLTKHKVLKEDNPLDT